MNQRPPLRAANRSAGGGSPIPNEWPTIACTACRRSADSGRRLFLGWSQFPEFEEEQEVVGPLQRAAYDEGPAEARKDQEVTRKKRAQGRGEASWNRGQTGGRRPLSWRHHRHDIGASLGTSICESALRASNKPIAVARFGAKGTRITKMFDGRCVNTMVLTRPKRVEIGTASRKESAESKPLQNRIEPGRRDRKPISLIEPDHQQRLCHVAVPRARSVGASGIVRPPGPPSAT